MDCTALTGWSFEPIDIFQSMREAILQLATIILAPILGSPCERLRDIPFKLPEELLIFR